MKNKEFVKLTLANGKKSAIIRTEHIAFAMALENTNDSGETTKFTRIIPKNLVIDSESNWIDVTETPEEIASLL